MVGTVGQTISTANNTNKLENLGNRQINASYVNHKYGDPDFLIREYFLSSSERRNKLRGFIFTRLSSAKAIIEVLKWGISGKARDAYDGAVDLLAEINEINILKEASQYLEALSQLMINSVENRNILMLDPLWEILIKGTACAYRIPAEERFELLLTFNLIALINQRRILKATFIDALLLLADEIDTQRIKNAIARFASGYETDQYIRNYAEEAIQELS
ncbi:hypothetical protein GNE08_01675 [Trichormus variabilis ARAD]|uniref:DNA alkylation repair protein n=1 Tax=Trichormus variabilis N2B TaxID=2681315 RepID=A0ABR6S829_ANAVA|nr:MULTISPECIES: hypothetical protein [Nostocaceae]MBC1212931.1 hypothetical protein [Trichormus variabilis ARAD]MBC1257694.1 hypothetical protein [Trichormus variabilis V5]MBC1269995.1 hypothetical protein [Trichormus variabilis FSR]MBC1302562.1 hypothetical protein [Trichormus variabilis N2B]MBC1311018.1 hypothetical protein [Trichormus variabilis PNB]